MEQIDWNTTRTFIDSDFRNAGGGKDLVNNLVILFFNLSFQVIMLYRLSHYLASNSKSSTLTTILCYGIQIISSCHIHSKAIIGRNLHLPHPTGIVIGKNVIVRENVTIFQGVTLGSHGHEGETAQYPIIESDVTIYAGASIIGGVQIHQFAIIGAGSVVLTDVPAYSIAVGSPARIILGH